MAARFLPPLPPGWEGRWDPSQKAYFYIDHTTKTTSWEDPRTLKLATTAAGGQAIPLHDLSHETHFPSPSHSAHQTSTSKDSTQRHGNANLTQQQETSFSNKQQSDLDQTVSALREKFPDASPVIRDILNMCGGNAEIAATQLKELGFESVGDIPKHSRSTTTSPTRNQGQSQGQNHGQRTAGANPIPKTSASTAAPKSSGGKAEAKQSGGRSTPRGSEASSGSTPKHPRLPHKSDAEKQYLRDKLCGEFKALEREVVHMALDSCDYDEERTRGTLSRVTESWKTSGSNVTATAANSAMPKPLQLPEGLSLASLEPVSFASNDKESSKPVSHEGSNARGTKQLAKNSATSQPRKSEQLQHAMQVTKLSQQLVNSTGDLLNHLATSAAAATCCTKDQHTPKSSPKLSPKPSPKASLSSPGTHRPVTSQQLVPKGVVTSQPRPEQRHDQLRQQLPYREGVSAAKTLATQARGRDLARGPDPNLRVGPNHSIRAGPDPSLLLHEPLRSQGPTPAFYHGSMPNLASGSCGAQGSNPMLRCSSQQLSRSVINTTLIQTRV